MARCAIIVAIILLSALGVVVLIGAYHVVRRTPQERLALLHSESANGAFPLRALRFDSRRGVIRELMPTASIEADALSAEQSNAAAAKQLQQERSQPIQYVLLVHGLKSTADQWLPFVDGFLERHVHEYVFIAPDLLGHGKSPWPDARSTPHNVPRHMACLISLLERLVPRGATLHVIGHSLGAMLALELAALLARQGRQAHWHLCSVTLMATPFYESAEEAERAARRHYSWMFRHRWLAHAMCGYLFCRQHWLWCPTLQRRFEKRFPNLPKTMFAAAMQHSHKGIFSCAVDCVQKHRGHRAARMLRSAGVPVLLIDASDDALCDGTQQRLADELGPIAQRATLNGAGHAFVVHQVDETVDCVRPFVEAAATAAAAERSNNPFKR